MALDKMFTAQAQGAKFEPRHPPVFPALERQRQEDPWGMMNGQPR